VSREAVQTGLLLLFLFLDGLGGFLAFLPFHFLLALLDDFRLRRGRRNNRRRFHRLLFLDAQRHHVRQHAVAIGQQLELALVDRQFVGAQALIQHQSAHVHPELRRDVRGQAFYFHFARHHFVDATLHLHARR